MTPPGRYWIKLAPDIWTHAALPSPRHVMLWVYLLCHARRSGDYAGVVAQSVRQLGAATGIPKSMVAGMLRGWEADGMISWDTTRTQAGRKPGRIRISNYKTWQRTPDTRPDTSRTQAGQLIRKKDRKSELHPPEGGQFEMQNGALGSAIPELIAYHNEQVRRVKPSATGFRARRYDALAKRMLKRGYTVEQLRLASRRLADDVGRWPERARYISPDYAWGERHLERWLNDDGRAGGTSIWDQT
ncbi:MAG: hypothetical protein RQ723_12770 [Desulfuromonadales bacterium]|nr:hypothetical protein [Desulfuromonadales bacterium]